MMNYETRREKPDFNTEVAEITEAKQLEGGERNSPQ